MRARARIHTKIDTLHTQFIYIFEQSSFIEFEVKIPRLEAAENNGNLSESVMCSIDSYRAAIERSVNLRV